MITLTLITLLIDLYKSIYGSNVPKEQNTSENPTDLAGCYS